MPGIRVFTSLAQAEAEGYHLYDFGKNGVLLVRKELATVPKSFGLAIVDPRGVK